MKLSLAVRSLIVFALSIILLVIFTLADRAIAGMSLAAQRLIAFVALVVVPGFGVALGAMSFARKEGRVWLAIIGVMLNALFAAFHLMVILFAG